jgi:hypothetical protein
MADYGFAANWNGDGYGWALDAQGQIVRAQNAGDKMKRLLRPFFGAVALEPYRGSPDRAMLKKRVDAAPIICQDRARLLLKPMLDAGEISNLRVVASVQATAPEFIVLAISVLDERKQPISMTEFVRIP